MRLLLLAFLVGAALARPDVDVCKAELEKSRARDMVRPHEINSLCVLADRGFLGTDVIDCVKKITSDEVLGRRVGHGDAGHICDAVRDVVVSYLTSH